MKKAFRSARETKNKYYDGKFYFGVKTTGIFCRPSCPSPVAKEKNVIYFNSVFKALEQNFRPCYRCRPDIDVEYYNGNIAGVYVVDMALQMIYKGYLTYHSIKDLANELLVSDRHLRKLFVDNLGIPPVKIAKYHKALFAKKLLKSSKHSITEIAFSSGFNSIRQFNDIFKSVFKTTPTVLRKEMLSDSKFHNNSDTTLLLSYKKPFDFPCLLSFIKPRLIPGVESISNNSYSRTFRTKDSKGFFTVSDCPELSSLKLKIVSNDIRCYMQIYNRVRFMFDLDTDFSRINKLFLKDKLLSSGMNKKHVPRLPVAFDPFEFIVRAILGQQITVKAATTLAGRIASHICIKTDKSFPNKLNYYFPTAKELSAHNLDGIAVMPKRIETIKNVVKLILNKTLKLSTNQTFDNFYKKLITIKGIGPWTVNYVAMRALGMTDIFLASDLGVLKALSLRNQTIAEKIGEKWKPYRSYATLCLWNSLDKKGT